MVIKNCQLKPDEVSPSRDVELERAKSGVAVCAGRKECDPNSSSAQLCVVNTDLLSKRSGGHYSTLSHVNYQFVGCIPVRQGEPP
jgi:hypothetical protein